MVFFGLVAADLVVVAPELSKSLAVKAQAWWAIHHGSLHVATPVTITLIVSATLVLCWLVMYLSPYQTSVRLTILDGYGLDETGL